MINLNCPSCKQPYIKHIGKIPSVKYFAGNLLTTPLEGGDLYKCEKCNLSFRYPTLSKETMDILYSNNKSSVWENEVKDRPDWQICKQWVSEILPAGSVLDVGCFDGRLLGTLDTALAKYGIEISVDAANQAKKIGIDVIGNDFSTLLDHVQKFDVAISIDVIEHVKDPHEFLEQIASSVKTGGWIIVSTGNANSLAWRIAGARYWYNSLAEHISFISPKWFALAAKKSNLGIIKTIKFCHSPSSTLEKSIAIIKAIYHRIKNGTTQIYGPADDHFIVLLKKSI